MLLKSLLAATQPVCEDAAPQTPAAGSVAAPAPSSRIQRRAAPAKGGMVRDAKGQPVLPENFFKTIVDEQDRNSERARLGVNDNGYVHVSSLIDACARREVLASLYKEDRYRTVHGGDRLVWAYGRAYESHVRGQFIQGFKGSLYGRWECRCGHRHFLGKKPHAEHVCPRCQLPMDVYKEHPITNDRYGLSGNADLPVLLDDNYLLIGECKSIEGEAWKALEQPLGDHVVQAATYRRLYQMAGWKVHDHVVILYGSKHYRWGSPYKEFHVDGTSRTVQTAVSLILEAGAEVKRHREAGTLPDRTCSAADIYRSKSCLVCGLCWNLS